MLPGDSGRWATWLSGSGGVVGAVESEGASDGVPFVGSTTGAREGASAVPSSSVMVFLRLSLNTLAGWRMMEDNPRLLRFPECSPVGVDGRDRTEPENRPLFGEEVAVGSMVLLV